MGQVKVRFRAAGALSEYHSLLLDLRDGQEAAVPEEEARRLLADFPLNFELAEPKQEANPAPQAEPLRPQRARRRR